MNNPSIYFYGIPNTSMKSLAPRFLLFVAAASLASCSSDRGTSTTGNPTMGREVEVVATIPADTEVINSDFQPPYQRVDLVVKTKTGAQVVIANGDSSPMYDEVTWGPYRTPTSFSEALKRWGEYQGPDKPVYMARRGKKVFAVINGVEGPSFDSIDPYTAIPLKDGSVVYAGVRGKKTYISLRGKEYGPYDGWKDIPGFIISPNGERVVFVAKQGKKNQVVIDGVAGKLYAEVSEPIFTPDNRQLGFLALDSYLTRLSDTHSVHVVVEGKEQTTVQEVLDVIPPSPLLCQSDAGEYLFLPDSGDCASISRAKFTRVTDTNYYAPTMSPPDHLSDPAATRYENHSLYEVKSRDGSISAFTVGSGVVITKYENGESTSFKKGFVVINGKEEPQYTNVWMPVLSEDERSLIYGAYDEDRKEFLRVIWRF